MAEKIVLIVGLGNPSPEYEQSRHNIGFMVVDYCAQKFGIPLSKQSFVSLWGRGKSQGTELIFVKPQTFMNRSGESVQKMLHYYKLAAPQSLIVIHDDLDLPFGVARKKWRGGYAGHHGLESIHEVTGTDEFRRIRLGIGKPLKKGQTTEYVLSPFSREEKSYLPQLFDKSLQFLEEFIKEISAFKLQV